MLKRTYADMVDGTSNQEDERKPKFDKWTWPEHNKNKQTWTDQQNGATNQQEERKFDTWRETRSETEWKSWGHTSDTEHKFDTWRETDKSETETQDVVMDEHPPGEEQPGWRGDQTTWAARGWRGDAEAARGWRGDAEAGWAARGWVQW
jgi:hypothetical protein